MSSEREPTARLLAGEWSAFERDFNLFAAGGDY
jgi:hypothetical protein